MTTKEMIEVMKAFERGEEIEVSEDHTTGEGMDATVATTRRNKRSTANDPQGDVVQLLRNRIQALKREGYNEKFIAPLVFAVRYIRGLRMGNIELIDCMASMLNQHASDGKLGISWTGLSSDENACYLLAKAGFFKAEPRNSFYGEILWKKIEAERQKRLLDSTRAE